MLFPSNKDGTMFVLLRNNIRSIMLALLHSTSEFHGYSLINEVFYFRGRIVLTFDLEFIPRLLSEFPPLLKEGMLVLSEHIGGWQLMYIGMWWLNEWVNLWPNVWYVRRTNITLGCQWVCCNHSNFLCVCGRILNQIWSLLGPPPPIYNQGGDNYRCTRVGTTSWCAKLHSVILRFYFY